MVQRIFFHFSALGTREKNKQTHNERKQTHVSMSNEISVRTFSGHLEHNTQEDAQKKKMNRSLWQFLILLNDCYANIMNRSLSNGNSSPFDSTLKVYANSLHMGRGGGKPKISNLAKHIRNQYIFCHNYYYLVGRQKNIWNMQTFFYWALGFGLYCPELVSFIDPSMSRMCMFFLTFH